MTLTKLVKWLLASTAVVSLGAGLLGADSVANSPIPGGIAIAHADDGDHDDHDRDGGLLWEPGESNVYIAEAPAAMQALNGGAPNANVNITVTYVGTWPTDAVTALERAVSIWESIIQGSGPISISATYDTSITSLGQGGPALHGNFPGAPQQNVWYPAALVNQIRGLDHGATPDINLKMKSNPPQPWHFGAGQAPTGTIDFTSVALHEIGHGLGHSDSFTTSGSDIVFGSLGNPVIHDTFAQNNAGTRLIDLGSATSALKAAVTSNGVYFGGLFATAANNGVRPKLSAPSTFSGASISHLDEATYNNTPNALMTPVFTGNETIREPGPIMRAQLKDYGYTIADPAPTNGTVQFLQTANSTAESAGTLNVPVTRTNGSAGAASVQCQVNAGGTAATPADFTISTATVSWANGESGTRNCVLAIVNDAIAEGDETINLILGNVTGAAIGTPSTTSVKILANDQAGTIQFTSGTLSVPENAGATNIQISRTGGAQGVIGATCAVTGGTAAITTDFTLSNTVLSWLDGQATNDFCTITPVNNGAASGNKTVVITLQSPTGSPPPTIGATSTVTVTIVDDDNAGTIQFASRDFGSVSENEGDFAFGVERTGGSSGAVSAVCSIDPGQTTASANDYAIVNVAVSWADGESGLRECLVNIIDDDLGGEGDETITMALTPPFTGGAVAGTVLSTTMTIEDNDPPLLIFTTQPANGHNGFAFDQQTVVEIQTSLGDTISDVDVNVTLTLVPSRSWLPAPVLSCSSNPVATVAGVARFSGCVITGATGGMELRLRATAPGMATGTSAPFTIADVAYDATCDGEVTSTDALAILRALAGFSSGILPVAPCTGDANNSGGLDVNDARIIRDFVSQGALIGLPGHRSPVTQ